MSQKMFLNLCGGQLIAKSAAPKKLILKNPKILVAVGFPIASRILDQILIAMGYTPIASRILEVSAHPRNAHTHCARIFWRWKSNSQGNRKIHGFRKFVFREISDPVVRNQFIKRSARIVLYAIRTFRGRFLRVELVSGRKILKKNAHNENPDARAPRVRI